MTVHDTLRFPTFMSIAVVPAIIAIAVLSEGASQSERETPVDLRQYQWKNRLLFVFAPTREEPPFKALHDSIVARKADVEDRDLVVFEVLESDPSTRDGEPLDPASARQLRERFGAPAGEFSVVLVGKDGGVKLDRQDRTSLDEIFALIDSMPMRQHEMRRQNP
jgi:hypothetical protein